MLVKAMEHQKLHQVSFHLIKVVVVRDCLHQEDYSQLQHLQHLDLLLYPCLIGQLQVLRLKQLQAFLLLFSYHYLHHYCYWPYLLD